jgi:O-antigen/teichoic acid export membrane protein
MKQKIKQALKHPLIYGSAIIVIGNLVGNFFNFLFNLFMSRSLTVSDYGVFASIMSLIGIFMLVGTAIAPVVVRFAGDYFAQKNYPLLRGLYIKVNKLSFIIAGSVFLFFLFLIPTISEFFRIENKVILILTDFIIFFSLIGVINLAFLQAKLAFVFQVFVTLLNAIIKLVLGMILVTLGYSAGGAVFAMLIAGITMYFVSFSQLRFIFDKKIAVPTVSTKELLSYGAPSALTFFGLTAFISADIMLVKHFFDPHQAGLYAGMSLIGRVIFFVSAPIGGVMFPVIVQKHSRNENFTNTFKLSVLLVTIPSIVLTIFYAIFPKFSILFFLKREEYFAISNLIAPFALFITLYCLLYIIANFYLSIKKTKVYIPILIGAVMQSILIFFFHQTFSQIITISTVITLVLVIMLLSYYPHATRKGIGDRL